MSFEIINYYIKRLLLKEESASYGWFMCFCGRVPWLYQYWTGGFMLFVVLCPGTPECSTGSGSGFKASQKTGQRLKVSSDRLGEAYEGFMRTNSLNPPPPLTHTHTHTHIHIFKYPMKMKQGLSETNTLAYVVQRT